MPVLDHFRPPIKEEWPWSSFHANWATRIADQLTDRLTDDYRALELNRVAGGVEIDVATYRRPGPGWGAVHPDLTSAEVAGWVPPEPTLTTAAGLIYPDQFEVRVFHRDGGHKLVGAIELVSPGNKDRPEARQAFAEKVSNYLRGGVCVIVIDLVTERRAVLHHDIARLTDPDMANAVTADAGLYAVTYRPALRNKQPVLDVWAANFGVGDPLPTMPLRLTGDLFVPVEFEAAYMEACRKRKLLT